MPGADALRAVRTRAGAEWIKNRDPVAIAARRVPREVRWLTSGSRGLLFGHVLCLRALLALNDFELDVITLLQALVALRLDGAVVDEHVGTIISADEAEALRVIEPFHFSFNSRHDPCSEPSWKMADTVPIYRDIEFKLGSPGTKRMLPLGYSLSGCAS